MVFSMTWRRVCLQLFIAFFAVQGFNFSHTDAVSRKGSSIVVGSCAICEGLAVFSSGHSTAFVVLNVTVRIEAREVARVLESHSLGFTFRPQSRGPPTIA